jgi:intracellular multiplication protein IcmK
MNNTARKDVPSQQPEKKPCAMTLKPFLYAIACLSLTGVPLSPALAQNDMLSLESYLGDLGDEPPPEEALQTQQEAPTLEDVVSAEQEDQQAEAEESDDGGIFGTTIDDILGNEPAPEDSEESREQPVATQDDALPQIPNVGMRLQTEGFDNVATQNVRLQLDGVDLQRSQEEMAAEIRQEAFDAAMTGLFPLSTDNIRSLLGKYDETERAVQRPVHGVPQPMVNVQTISLDPGVNPMVLQTAVGYITTLNILDITGAPWPIQDVSWAGNFEVIEPEEGGHIIRISPMAKEAYGNMSIRLLTLKTPVTIRLETNIDRVQYRVDARIPEYGPFAETPLIEGGTERVAGDATLMSILDGTPPSEATMMRVSGVDGRTTAYQLNNMIYVRTPLTLLSPGWNQSVSSADGMNVYALNDTPVLLLSDQGSFKRANISLTGDILDE